MDHTSKGRWLSPNDDGDDDRGRNRFEAMRLREFVTIVT